MTSKDLDALLIQYEPLIKATANMYFFDGMDFEDILQELRMEFVKAARVYDESKASLKTLFITYTKNWGKYKMREQSFQKRAKLDLILNRPLEDNENDYTFLLSSEFDTPEVYDYKVTLNEVILEFLEENDRGHIIIDLIENEKTLKEIAKEKNISFQAVQQQAKRIMRQLRSHLIDRGYEVNYG